MKTNRLILSSSLVILLICGWHLCGFGETKVKPPDSRNLVGAWMGFDQDRVFFCRLELDKNGEGWFATVFSDNPARLYKVQKWSVEGFRIQFELIAKDKDAESLYLKGVVEPPQLTLEMGGVGAKWHRRLVLLNEAILSKCNAKVQECILKGKKGEGD